MNKIFISHKSEDKEVVSYLVQYLIGIGVESDDIFCSSIPGCDVNSIIAEEVKQAIKNSKLNIVILSSEYYNSAYCINEAGIIWFLSPEIPFIVVGLPEISREHMVGFLNSNNILRRLDKTEDVLAIADQIVSRFELCHHGYQITHQLANKLIKDFKNYCSSRTGVSNSAPVRKKKTDKYTMTVAQLLIDCMDEMWTKYRKNRNIEYMSALIDPNGWDSSFMYSEILKRQITDKEALIIETLMSRLHGNEYTSLKNAIDLIRKAYGRWEDLGDDTFLSKYIEPICFENISIIQHMTWQQAANKEFLDLIVFLTGNEEYIYKPCRYDNGQIIFDTTPDHILAFIEEDGSELLHGKINNDDTFSGYVKKDYYEGYVNHNLKSGQGTEYIYKVLHPKNIVRRKGTWKDGYLYTGVVNKAIVMEKEGKYYYEFPKYNDWESKGPHITKYDKLFNCRKFYGNEKKDSDDGVKYYVTTLEIVEGVVRINFSDLHYINLYEYDLRDLI